MKSSRLSCTGVSRNIKLRNLTQKYNCIAEFVVCCAQGFMQDQIFASHNFGEKSNDTCLQFWKTFFLLCYLIFYMQ